MALLHIPDVSLISMKRILLVDDDNIFNFVHTKMLELSGVLYDIQIAHNGQEAIEALLQQHAVSGLLPDVILLDLNMPVMDGFTFIEVLNGLMLPGKESIKIIIVTSSNNPSDVARAKKLGIRHFLTKAVEPRDLTIALNDD